MRMLKIIVMLTVSLISTLSFVSHAEMQKVIKDSNNNPVRDSFGGCVRSSASANKDECDNKQPVQASTIIYFDFDSDVILDNEKDKIKTLISGYDEKNLISFVIYGYTDRIGKEKYNQTLSSKRADSTANFINELGYLSTPVKVGKGVYSTDKLCSKLNDKELRECLSKDRRVEILLEYKQ
jgi:outer membrane protein OmpA-like peptidoglycan-associated protein